MNSVKSSIFKFSSFIVNSHPGISGRCLLALFATSNYYPESLANAFSRLTNYHAKTAVSAKKGEGLARVAFVRP